MRKVFLTSLMLVFALNMLFGQQVRHIKMPVKLTLDGNWELKNHSVFDSVLTFQQIQLPDTTIDFAGVFKFGNGKVDYKLVSKYGVCGNGLFYLSEGNYQLREDRVVLYLRGGYMVESSFTYKAMYYVQRRKNSLVFRLKKVFKKEIESSFD